MSLCHLLATHVSHVCDWLVVFHPHTRRTRITLGPDYTMGPYRVDYTVPRGPINRQYMAQSDRILQSTSVRLLRISPISASSLVLSAQDCFPRLRDLISLLICPLASPLQSSRIFQVLHSYPALVPINALNRPTRSICIVHLVQDCFLSQIFRLTRE